MRYGSSLNPDWMVASVWKRRWPIFCAISAVSLAGNAVVLAESLHIRRTLTSLLHRLLPQLLDFGEILVQRPVLFMLLNLIMLKMVVTSGFLGRGRGAPKQHDQGRAMPAAGTGGRRGADKSVPNSQYLDDPAEFHDQEQSMIMSLGMKRRSSAVLFAYTEPEGAVGSANASTEQADDAAARQLKGASLFTIEPLEPSMTLLQPSIIILGEMKPAPPTLQPSIIILGAAQPEMDTALEPPSVTLLAVGQPSIIILDTAAQPDVGAAQPEMDTALASPSLTLIPAAGLPSIIILGAAQPDKGTAQLGIGARDDLQSEACLVPHKHWAPGHFIDNGHPDDYDLNRQEFTGHPDDYDLNRQEFTARVDTFIVKIKANRFMQRQDSIKRVLGLVVGSVKRDGTSTPR